ncbi:hypothetical protein Aple_098550 [Acrocarpospora pleiomorpha]|uniref:Uncharacterized protein n=1 Tax=Acrocarpospora pleiomorpha TaxID=90975 RepID=A0A5M3Y179_9ACTN|nr:hypothetical protein [Acrocarpospora pleiomorpha]GES26956.1 hypothetical protein Aple_098550 [Acrocarpospora pleiomorpha]
MARILTLLPGEETPDPAGRRRWVQLVLRSHLVDGGGRTIGDLINEHSYPFHRAATAVS